MAKANLSSLVHELRERIAASSSTPTPTNPSDDDALEVRFRTLLPNLLHAYVLPSSSGNEREVIAVVKLISHTARNFPAVFYRGKASAVLPILARILPFFAEPHFRSRHGVFFEAIGSLLSLLRSGARDAYRQFFVDSMSLIQADVSYVASWLNVNESSRVRLTCFSESFSGIEDLPSTNKPVDGRGLLIELTGRCRWQPFATWILKLISKCLTEGTLYVEGLIHASFISAACSLLCYGNADLHMIALCSAYARIAKVCPPHIWQPEYLIRALYHPEPCLPLIECFQVALSTLGPHLVGGTQGNNKDFTMLAAEDKSIEGTRLGQKRPIQDMDKLNNKRQKLNDEIVVADVSLQVECKSSHIVTCQRAEGYASHMNKSLLSFVQSLNIPAVRPGGSLRPDVALSALSMLCIAFSSYPETDLSLRIFQQMLAWLPWIADQAKKGNSITVDISTYLEGIHSVLLVQSKLWTLPKLRFDTVSASFKEHNLLHDKSYHVDLIPVLKLPWTHMLVPIDNQCPWKTKCLSLRVVSKLGSSLNSKVVLEVLDLGLHDEAEEVRTEAAISMPVMVLWSGIDVSSPVFERME
ncbi:hypothetical protein Fmac_023034 [Flemingia macrophylla]|uniref:Uncharacterized protein n=1 Tax=Flemingia macrophylla TaxID=520843 RepID=A0ABD1LKI8_9FABA